MTMELQAGQLVLTLEQVDGGIAIRSIKDRVTGRGFFKAEPLPLFALTLREVETKTEVTLGADSGWSEAAIKSTRDGAELHWQLSDDSGQELHVVAQAALDQDAQAIRWTLHVTNDSDKWSLMRVVFPQVAIDELGEDGWVFFPRAPGEIKQGLWQKEFKHHGLYPEPWTTMQYMAAYTDDGGAGLYIATHDPVAGMKDMTIASRPDDRAVDFIFDHPAEDMTLAGNDFVTSGQVVWQLFRGDWFDATIIYRDWVRREAQWYPEMGPDGRADTPLWMREVPFWVSGGGDIPQYVQEVIKAREHFELPIGYHWYGWHQIPFDDDYPHYFPVQDAFPKGVSDLKDAGVYVMPYINGRLWDTHDKGDEDFEFTKVARPAATKDEAGEVYVEKYGSTEADGTPVALAVMCPTQKVWQDRIRDICLRLLNEYKVNGVYIDQIAAMSPKLCMDKSHGHPLGGGRWWNPGYWKMLQVIRDAMPDGSMLTSECNSEPFARWFDGYLSWTWQHDGQVPAFPAVYQGPLQMFGRQYHGNVLAMRMKSGQQLVFGEQIGWVAPGFAMSDAYAAFFKQVVHLRWCLRRYFYAGEMARPPKLSGDVPTVTDDWEWAGQKNWMVTTDAVLTGAWRQPQDGKLAIIFVNVSDEPVSAEYAFDAASSGFNSDKVKLTRITADGPGETTESPATFTRKLDFPARTAWAWEITAAP